MAAEWGEEFDIEVEFTDTEAAEMQAEVLDQTISLLRSMKECCNLDTRDKENLDAITGANLGCRFSYDEIS